MPAFPRGFVSVWCRANAAWLASALRQIQFERIGGDMCTYSIALSVLSQSIVASSTVETKCVCVAHLE